MKKYIFVFSISIIALILSSCGTQTEKESYALYPEIEPFKTDYLQVSNLHDIYYELCGNPDGNPIFMLHGGPGGSSSPYMRRFCNPEKFLIVLYDQRGAGKSKPWGEIKDNTTQHLVEDIEKLRNHLNLNKILLLGGSWGTTLALAYAETYPDNVSGLILRGTFTATKAEIDHFYHGGVSTFFPETYKKLLSALPDKSRKPLPDYLFELIQNSTGEEQKRYTKAWAIYESKIAWLEIADDILDEYYDEHDPYVFALFENYYMSNGCFLEETELLNNAYKIGETPVIMVNGRYDMICPPINAYRLHEKLQNSKLVIAESAGHWMGDKPIERELIKAVRSFD